MEGCYLLISDVDGTLLGDNGALAEFAEWYEQRRHWLKIVYNSGRLVGSVQESVERTALPNPHAIIGGVGTQVWCCESKSRIDGWPADQHGWHPARIHRVLAEYPELTRQPDEFQADFKISYFAINASTSQLNGIRDRLSAEYCDVELIYSSNRDLDILPRGANKGSACAFIAEYFSVSHHRVIVSGDSGNDLAMFGNGFRGIVVDNAHPELKSLNSPDVFQANRPFAAGVLQGMTHWLDELRE